MSIYNITLPSNIFSMKGNEFYIYLESNFSVELKELIRLQGFSSAASIVHSPQRLLDFVQIDSNDINLLSIKKTVAFHQNDGTWKIKPGIQYDVDCLMFALDRMSKQEVSNQPDGSMFVSADVLRRFPWLESVIGFCQHASASSDRNDLTFLSSFIENISNNIIKPSSRNRYSPEIKQFAFVLFVLAGRQGYEFVRINLPGSLPCLSTLSAHFNENREKLLEGQFRFSSMKNHFESTNVKYVFASEDCTGVLQKVSYDRDSNSFVGLCPPLQIDGCPRVSSLRIDSFHELEILFKDRTISSLLNIHTLQPILSEGQRASPFLLSAYGTDNKFDTYDLINRWLKIFDSTLEQGIRIVGFSTDCDSRYLRTMRLMMNFFSSLPNVDLRKRPDTFKIDLPSSWKWFFLDPVQLFVVFQDPTHLATKIRNRMLSSSAFLLMGNQHVSINALRQILSSSSKFFHGLVSSDLNPRDHQNYASCWRISRDEVIRALSTLENAKATFIYVKLLRSIIDAYIENSTSLLDRVLHAWTGVFISRLWLVWIDKMGKKKLDKLLTNLTEISDEFDCPIKRSSQQYFLTQQAVYSMELNAHCLVYLIFLVIEGKLPKDVLAVERFHSQSCEAMFRAARAFSSGCSSGVNFSVLQFLNLTDKLSLFQKIKTEHEQSISPTLRFPTHHKNKPCSSSNDMISDDTSLPTKATIEQVIIRAFKIATAYFEEVGVMSYLRQNHLSTILEINNHARTLFDDARILDYYSPETGDDEDENHSYDRSTSGFGSNDSIDEDESFSILRFHDDPESLQPTFRGMRVTENVPPHLEQSYFKIRINGQDKYIHKSSACWVLADNNQKLSSDRTKRVTQSK